MTPPASLPPAALQAITEAIGAVPAPIRAAVTEAAVGLVVDVLRGRGVVRAAKLRAVRAAFNAATDAALDERARRIRGKKP